ncbi:hypothetical protein B0H15DRAFT_1026518 [Mycena belliarum]|uniref:Uncharacterized protein n=1 Tax=Mycena belliarum TaxID=1033014 RepID=A0AAD6XIA2_9AGAR|nr:hypothetical protein B0H15DRAFT_1026518 [Mycena belliae]
MPRTQSRPRIRATSSVCGLASARQLAAPPVRVARSRLAPLSGPLARSHPSSPLGNAHAIPRSLCAAALRCRRGLWPRRRRSSCAATGGIPWTRGAGYAGVRHSDPYRARALRMPVQRCGVTSSKRRSALLWRVPPPRPRAALGCTNRLRLAGRAPVPRVPKARPPGGGLYADRCNPSQRVHQCPTAAHLRSRSARARGLAALRDVQERSTPGRRSARTRRLGAGPADANAPRSDGDRGRSALRNCASKPRGSEGARPQSTLRELEPRERRLAQVDLQGGGVASARTGGRWDVRWRRRAREIAGKRVLCSAVRNAKADRGPAGTEKARTWPFCG